MVAPLIIAAGIGAAGSLAGGYLAGRKKQGAKPSPVEKKKGALIDQLLEGLNGNGSYANLYNTDENSFQKSFVDPAKARFNNQIAPQIQQNYIASGQQNGSGLQDQLLRAGVDMNQLLNESYGNYQEAARNRKQNTIANILGSGNGTPPQQSGGGLGDAFGGFLNSPAFPALVNAFSSSGGAASGGNTTAPSQFPTATMRRGYE